MVARLDTMESTTQDFMVEVEEALKVGDETMSNMQSNHSKQETRIDSLESEDKVLNQSISELSRVTTYLSTTIEPMKEDIKGLKKSTDKTNDLLMKMNTNISLLMGKLGGV